MCSWLIVNASTETPRWPLWSLIQKLSLLNHSFKNKAICSTGISIGTVPMGKKKNNQKTWAQRQDCSNKLPSKSQVTTIYKLLSYVHFDSKTRRTGLVCKQNDSRIGITLPTGGITAATNS